MELLFFIFILISIDDLYRYCSSLLCNFPDEQNMKLPYPINNVSD